MKIKPTFSIGPFYHSILIRKIIGCIPILVTTTLFSPSYGQEVEFDYTLVDGISYSLYQDHNWDSLAVFGEVAINQGFDYFYLRARTGIAWFYKKNYMRASMHLDKAHIMNKSDKTVMKYLYQCYLLTNRDLDRSKLLKSIGKDFETNYYSGLPFRKNMVNFETGPVISDNIERNGSLQLAGSDSIFGMQDLNDNKYYNAIGFETIIYPGLSIYLGYNHLIISKLKQMQWYDVTKVGYDTIPYFGGFYVDTVYGKEIRQVEDKYKLYQHGIYFNISYALDNGWSLTPAGQYLKVRYSTFYASNTFVPYYEQSYDTLPYYKNQVETQIYDVNIDNVVVSLAANKYLSCFNVGGYASYSNLNNLQQYQVGFSAFVYPKGNLDFYASSFITLAWEGNDTRPFFGLTTGSRITGNIWGEFSLEFGRMKNYNENNAYLVYNSGDEMNFRAKANFFVTLSDELDLTLRYKYQSLMGFREELTANYILETTSIYYTNHLIVGGLAWNF